MPIYFKNTPVSEPFAFSSIGCHQNQESVSRPKGYPLYHYLQTKKGCGRIMIQGKIYLLNEGSGVLIAPSIRHSYWGKTEEWGTLFVTFTGMIEGSLTQVLGNRDVIFIEQEQGAHIGTLISDIIKKHEHPPVDAKSLSVDCYSLLMNFVDGVYALELKQDPLYLRYVEPVVKEIETHYGRELTVQNLSQQVYISPQYLSRLFSRFLGCSAYEYLTTYRLNRAKEFLLTDPRMQIQDIAQQVGFQDPSHFIAMFKKMTGMTPLDFRKFN